MNRLAQILALPALALMAGCSTAPSPTVARTPAPVAAPAERVTFTISSWGQPQRVWTLEADGSLLVETKAAGGTFVSYDLDQRRTVLTAEQAAAVRAQLVPAGGPLPHCTVIMTDGPSIFLQWAGPPERTASIYMGCAEQAFRPIIEQAMQADTLVNAAVEGVAASGKRHIGR